ncbi:MAG TPA: suppressor of fused domain protein [Dongiaceae bacterium]
MEWEESVESHYRSVWGVDAEPRQFSAGAIQRLPVDFIILRYPPHAERALWAYATCGMSQPDDAAPLELHMFSPRASPEIEELLVVTAGFHRTYATLDVGHSVNFGRPWLTESNCRHGLISLPYVDGPTLENLRIGETLVKCYWLIPVTLDEVNYKQLNGLEALEQTFERKSLNYWDPSRESTV